MAINAPALVLTAAALSVISRGGIVSPDKKLNPPGPAYVEAETMKFWAALLFATGGIILVDKYNSDLAKGMASLWIVGGVIVNGKTIIGWLTGFGQGIVRK